MYVSIRFYIFLNANLQDSLEMVASVSLEVERKIRF